jgi:hypothetical protein
MPFTLSHPAAAVPFARLGLPLSALVVGSISPDVIFFVLLYPPPRGHFSHTWLGMVLLCLPLSMVLLWLYHHLMKWPIISLLPDRLQRRVVAPASRFRFGPAPMTIRIVAAVLVGTATHLVWDDLTHGDGVTATLLPALLEPVSLPGEVSFPRHRLLQHLSTLLGAGLLCAWAASWMRNAPEHEVDPGLRISPGSKTTRAGLLLFACSAFALANGYLQFTVHERPRAFLVGVVLAFFTAAFVILALSGINWKWTAPSGAPTLRIDEEEERFPPPGRAASD